MPQNPNPLFSQSKVKPKAEQSTPTRDVIPWKVLIVDDEPEVHAVTAMVLRDFELNQRPIKLVDAYTAADARAILAKENDFALCLIDVVMETNEAGLDLVKHIRSELKNRNVRLVLRTGQPGYAPEKDVIRDYDINDYKDKTELTDTKLHTLMCSAFRAYDDITRLEQNRTGLEMVIAASATIFEASSLQKFTSAVLIQLMALVNPSSSAVMVKASGFSATEETGEFQILAGFGEFQSLIGTNRKEHLPADVKSLLDRAGREKMSVYEQDHLVLFSQTKQGNLHLLYLQHYQELSIMDQRLMELFCGNVSIAYENHMLQAEIEQTQSEIVCILGEAIENRSKESGNHIYRVAEMTAILAKAHGYNIEEIERIKAAAPLHDVGKVGIPDNILHKPGKLDADEWAIMKTHVEMGYNMLKSSQRKILKYAATIAKEHHEHWDGNGYPHGLVGEKIHILGRIVGLVDVFDALTSVRCYKQAWPIETAVDTIKEQSGKQFDPYVVDLFLQNFSAIQTICEEFVDPA